MRNIRSSILMVIACFFVSLTSYGQKNYVDAGVSWEDGPYQPTWKSLMKTKTPEWMLDAKFGIYAHWGIYSVGIGPAWTERHLYSGKKKTVRNFEELTGKSLAEGYGYKDLLPFFTAKKYKPAEWVKLIEKSGAKFAGFSIAHHDNFGLWDSDVDDWNAGKRGPKRDLYGEFARELKKTDVKLYCTSHMYRHYKWMGPAKDQLSTARKEHWDAIDPEYNIEYQNEYTGVDYKEYRRKWKLKIKEVIDRYMPDALWFDGAVNRGVDHLEPLAHYFNKAEKMGKEVVVMNKYPISDPGFDAEYFNFPNHFGVLNFEQGRDRPLIVPDHRYWTEDFTITGKAWSYTGDDRSISDKELIKRIIDITARGGCAIVSLCPRADGSIPQSQQDALLGAGAWLKTNGEAIFATRTWEFSSDETAEETSKYIHTYSDKPNKRWHYDEMKQGVVRYTQSKDHQKVYAITYGLPKSPKVIAKHLGKANAKVANHIQSVTLLGFDRNLSWTQKEDGLEIELPRQLPNNKALAFRIELKQ